MKRIGIVALMLIALISTATVSHAGWFYNAGRTAGHAARHVTNTSRHAYSSARHYTRTHKKQWRHKAHKVYRNGKRAARQARKGFRKGYRSPRPTYRTHHNFRHNYHRR